MKNVPVTYKSKKIFKSQNLRLNYSAQSSESNSKFQESEFCSDASSTGGEFNSENQINQHAERDGLAVPPLLSSALRDTLYPGHDRDIRLFNWLFLPSMWISVTANVSILEASELGDEAIGHYFTCPSSTDEMLYLIAHR